MNHIQFEAVETRINQIISDQLISIENMKTKPRIDINEFESILLDLAEKLNERMEHLDPNISGQDDEIYQLQSIQSFLNEVHSEVFTYDQNRSRGKYTNK